MGSTDLCPKARPCKSVNIYFQVKQNPWLLVDYIKIVAPPPFLKGKSWVIPGRLLKMNSSSLQVLFGGIAEIDIRIMRRALVPVSWVIKAKSLNLRA